MKTEILKVRITGTEKGRIEEYAKKHHTTMSRIVLNAIREYLSNKEKIIL